MAIIVMQQGNKSKEVKDILAFLTEKAQELGCYTEEEAEEELPDLTGDDDEAPEVPAEAPKAKGTEAPKGKKKGKKGRKKG